MEIINVEVFITKQYIFNKDNTSYSCLVQIKNNQITDINVTADNGSSVDSETMEEIRNWAIMSVTDEYIRFCFQTEEDNNVKA